MHNYTETCKGICGYDLVYNFLTKLLPIKSYVFVAEFSRAFIMKTRLFPKPLLDMEMFLSM